MESNVLEKSCGYDFYENVLKKPKFVVAPMVDQSELAWRMLSRKYGAQLCYSPMFHASVFVRSLPYRKEALASCDGDRPLIIQFCANDPDTLIQAALMAQNHCDAVDLNLGCPQAIARKGYYGAFLSDNWELIAQLVRICHQKLSVPITCKIRVFSDVQKTVDYAKMLESAGCQLLTVHGRTKEMRGPNTGLADWKHIKAIKDALKIPVFANGNIQYRADVDRCFAETGVDGVMIAEGSLHNPALFTGATSYVWDMALEYLEFAEKYPCPISYARGHIFKICHHGLRQHTVARAMLSNSKSLLEIKEAVVTLRNTCRAECQENNKNDPMLPFSHWICQPYVRPPPSISTTQPENNEKNKELIISKKKLKKLLKRGFDASNLSELDSGERAAKIANFLSQKAQKVVYSKCVHCGNPGGNKCVFMCCRPCCKKRKKQLNAVCSYHSNNKRSGVDPEKTSQLKLLDVKI